MITSKFIVRRYSRDWDSWQNLIKVWYFSGIKIWSKVIDREEIPQYVYIQHLAFGDYYGWRSKFYEYIEAEHREKLKV